MANILLNGTPYYTQAFHYWKDYTILEISSDWGDFFKPSSVQIGSGIKSGGVAKEKPSFFLIIDVCYSFVRFHEDQ